MQDAPDEKRDVPRGMPIAGVDLPDKPHTGLPVAGYKPQSDSAVELVNKNKQLEENVLRVLDLLAKLPDTDKRWLAIGRTSIEQGFMAINRSIFQPGRVQLPHDEKTPNRL